MAKAEVVKMPNLSEEAKSRAVKVNVLGTWLAVMQHVCALQSDVLLFSQALRGNEAAISRALATTNALTGLIGLIVNQIGGKLSDAWGRRGFFLAGPLINTVCVLAVLRRSTDVFTLSVSRVLRSISITFSGTLMCGAALADICTPQEMKQLSPKTMAGVGISIIGGPYLESLALKIGKGNPLSAFKLMLGVAVVQLISYAKYMPETLTKPKALGSIIDIIVAVNPFSFIKVFMGNNLKLKKLVSIVTLQMCTDGKVISDLFQLWSSNNLGWTVEQKRDFVAAWGAVVFAGGAIVQPFLLKRLSTYFYTVVSNAFVGSGLAIHGLAENALAMWGGLPFLLPGINGGAAQGLKIINTEIAKREGYGNGEWAAWNNNMRVLVQSGQIVLLGALYGRCRERGLYSGIVYFWAAIFAAGLPQLIMMTLKRQDFELPEGSSEKA